MQLYLLRHAQSESNARWETNPGEPFHFPDPDLTDMGRKQAEAVAAALAQTKDPGEDNPHDPWNYNGFGITHIYSSLMLRTIETASRVSARLNLPIHGRTDMHEWGGIYEKDHEKQERTGIPGKTRAFFEENFPQVKLPEDFKENGWWDRPYETPAEVPFRAQRVLEWLLEKHRHTSDRVLMVSHGGFLNHMISTIVNVAPDQILRNLDQNFWLVLNNTGITRLEANSEFTGIVYHNRIDHLAPHLIT